MPPFRYAQLCPLARAVEIVGERWTLLLVRELLIGPQRFSDLRRRLPGLGASVLTERLARLEERGIVRRRSLPPPAASVVYELDEAGRALEPVALALGRWGARFLLPVVPGDHVEPDWLLLGLRIFAARGPTPALDFEVRIASEAPDVVAHVRGGPGGTRVLAAGDAAAVEADAVLRAPAPLLMGLMSGAIDPEQAHRSDALQVEGDPGALAAFPRLFEVDLGPSSREAGR